jgi:hypothetical protein
MAGLYRFTSNTELVIYGIIAEVQRFSQGEQADDMTLIVARCRKAPCGQKGNAGLSKPMIESAQLRLSWPGQAIPELF